MKLWLGNQEQEQATFTACELFGFSVGTYETKIVRGGVRDVSGLAWRIKSDTALVCYQRKLIPVCNLLHQFATRQGLADIGLDDHDLTTKLHSAVAWAGIVSPKLRPDMLASFKLQRQLSQIGLKVNHIHVFTICIEAYLFIRV